MTDDATTAAIPPVSVIVPAFNAETSLPAFFDAMRRQTASAGSFELLIVDDGSTDGTRELVRASGVARLVEAPERRGSYTARNLGVAEARGGILAFTDSDCVPADDWVERGIAHMDAGAELVAGHIEVPLGRRPSASALVDFIRHLDQERAVSNNFGMTANLWVARRLLERIGPFNAELISGGDTEFGQRADRAGSTVRYGADVVIRHEPRHRPAELVRKAWRLGFGAAQHIRHADGPLKDRKHICKRPGAYIPHAELWGVERLAKVGYQPSRSELLRMRITHYFCVQLPIAFGNLFGTLRPEPFARSEVAR